jgi:hypothetical protein
MLQAFLVQDFGVSGRPWKAATHLRFGERPKVITRLEKIKP